MNRQLKLWFCVTAIMLSIGTGVTSMPPIERPATQPPTQSLDNATYIDANKILMFVTNHGNFGRDLAGVFGNDYGTYFPYTTIADIETNRTKSVLYAAGLWVGGIDSVSGDTLVTVSEYSSEYVPGPMVGGTYQSDRPEFRVYTLYQDSLAGNPNQDYLDWPVDQGAPTDVNGDPLILGDQLTWSVFNDANPEQHNNNNGSTEPIGVEVQQTIWAADQEGDIEIMLSNRYPVSGPSPSQFDVTAFCTDRSAVTGHVYKVAIDSAESVGFCWHLIDLTLSDTVLAYQTTFGDTEVISEGFRLSVTTVSMFETFECVANGAGPLNPSEAAAAVWEGFPCPTGADPGGYITHNQQVGNGLWLIHTGDNGGTNGGGTRASYESFLERVFRGDAGRLDRLGIYDWEMRFTGSYDNSGVGGSYAWDAFVEGHAYWVPFELWRTGINTPDDPSDDLRLIPWIMGDATGDGTGDNHVFDLSQYGSFLSGSCHDGCEHSVSGGDNDPYTDWVYWRLPEDQTPGDAGYQAFEAAMKTDPQNWPGNELPVMDRTVLVNWNGGITPPFTQDLPEQGTIFRLRTSKLVAGDEFTFTAVDPGVLTTGPLGTSIFVQYKMVNKGNRTLRDFFLSLWSDPDLGTSGDDLVGCDTANNLLYCYNASESDGQFSGAPPAVGFRVLEGPIVYSAGDTAMVGGLPRANYRNLGMYSFNKYINGTDPDGYAESYCYMKGLDAKIGCWSYTNPTTGQPTRFTFSGDPVTGTGWLDDAPDDRRMMASFGPFTFRPGDTQQVTFKMAVGQGTSRLNSVTKLREALLWENTPTEVAGDEEELLPTEFSVQQNYPNPFNPATIIAYSLPRRAEVEVAVFNLLGQRVTTLIDRNQEAGEHSIVWKGTDGQGRAVASGIYFYRVKAGNNIETRKMMLLK